MFNVDKLRSEWAFADGLVVNPKTDPKTIGLSVLILRKRGEIITYDDQQTLSFLTLFKSKTEPKIKLIFILREGAFS